jgi:hypothetical protein
MWFFVAQDQRERLTNRLDESHCQVLS